MHNRVENIDIDAFLSGEVPPLLFPWEIEQEAVEKMLRINEELLNYDNGYELPEIVLEDYSVIGTYYRTNGEGELSPNYEAAFELAKKYNVELRELNMSKAREKLGIEARQPKSNDMQVVLQDRRSIPIQTGVNQEFSHMQKRKIKIDKHYNFNKSIDLAVDCSVSILVERRNFE